MKPRPDERVVHALDNPTARASRLRWLAKQLTIEGRRDDQRSAKAELYRAAKQLVYIANCIYTEQINDELDWIESGARVLASAVMLRTTDLVIDEAIHG